MWGQPSLIVGEEAAELARLGVFTGHHESQTLTHAGTTTPYMPQLLCHQTIHRCGSSET